MYTNTERFLRLLRHDLKPYLSHSQFKSSHLAEALAHGLDFGSAIALAQWSRLESRDTAYLSTGRFQKSLAFYGVSLPLDLDKIFAQAVRSALQRGGFLDSASAEELTQFLILAADTDNYREIKPLWLQKAERLMLSLFQALCCEREGGSKLTLDKIKQSIDLGWIHARVTQGDRLDTSLAGLIHYCECLPRWSRNKPIELQDQVVLDQHRISEYQLYAMLNWRV